MPSLHARDHRLRLDSETDALNVIASGLPGCIFSLDDLHPEFFDFSNGFAGAVLQKFSNYGYRIAILKPVPEALPARAQELARDHDRHPCIRFFACADQADKTVRPVQMTGLCAQIRTVLVADDSHRDPLNM